MLPAQKVPLNGRDEGSSAIVDCKARFLPRGRKPAAFSSNLPRGLPLATRSEGEGRGSSGTQILRLFVGIDKSGIDLEEIDEIVSFPRGGEKEPDEVLR